MADSVDLADALQQMDEAGQRPDGFLIRVIVTPGSADDLQPFSTSVYGVTVTRNYDLNTATFEKEGTIYHVYDIVAFVPFTALESEMKETDKLLANIISQSREMGHIGSISQAVHFIYHPPQNSIESDPEDDDLF